MQNHPMNTSKRPGYSSVSSTIKPFHQPASGQLSQGLKVTTKLLEDFGIANSDTYEVRIAWRYLGLVDLEDRLTEIGEQLAHTSDEEFPALLEKTVRYAYKDIFDKLKPAHTTLQELKEFFQNSSYEPATMRSKMFTLFRGLCRRAGIILADHETSYESKEYTLMQDPQQAKLNGLSQSHWHYTLLEKQVDVLQLLLQMRKNAEWTGREHEWWEENFRMNANMLLKLLEEKE